MNALSLGVRKQSILPFNAECSYVSLLIQPGGWMPKELHVCRMADAPRTPRSYRSGTVEIILPQFTAPTRITFCSSGWFLQGHEGIDKRSISLTSILRDEKASVNGYEEHKAEPCANGKDMDLAACVMLPAVTLYHIQHRSEHCSLPAWRIWDKTNRVMEVWCHNPRKIFQVGPYADRLGT